ncbi:MAG: flagellar FliJ family protein [Candidatus Poribacteria bacterium]
MRFKFRLETLLKYRKSIEDQYRMELASLKEKQLLEEEKMFDIRENQRILQNNLQNNSRNSLLYLEELSRQSIVQRKILSELNQEITEKRNRLIDVSKSRKIIEKLKEKKLDEYKQNLNIKENKAVDELVTNRFLRKDSSV